MQQRKQSEQSEKIYGLTFQKSSEGLVVGKDAEQFCTHTNAITPGLNNTQVCHKIVPAHVCIHRHGHTDAGWNTLVPGNNS